MSDELNRKTRQQFVNKTRQEMGILRGTTKRKSTATKGFQVTDLVFDTEEVDGSSPFGPTT
jgi:hypothetical protein